MDSRAYWIAFNHVSGIGSARLSQLIETCGSVEAAWKAPIQQLKAAGLDRRSLENLLAARRQVDVVAIWQRVQNAGIGVVTWEDAGYPENLRQSAMPPPVLYVRGTLLPQDRRAVALVGTRRASAYGREVARTLAAELAKAGVTIVSGLALGIDAVAHAAALDAGGRTVAVLGSGVDQLYPAQNRKLAETMMERGAIVSEYRLGTRPEAANFPPRNRIISGLSRGVVVVEAGLRSGALITARFAADQGRDVFAVPGSIFHPGSAGCNQLIQDGATPLLSAADVLTQLHLPQSETERMNPEWVPADPLEQSLFGYLSATPSHVDEIVRQLTLPAAEVTGALTVMELKGVVRNIGGMRFVRV